MENLSLNAEIRSGDEKLKDIRASKKLPAVVYGHSQKSMSIKLDYSEFLKTFRKS
jgi:ribosomal protein L25 (general stress protein Ctc)